MVAQARYFVPVVALEWLVIALFINDAMKNKKIAQSVLIMAGGGVLILLLALASYQAQAYILTHDEDIQRVYRFSLAEPMGQVSFTCMMDRGHLSALNRSISTNRTSKWRPNSGRNGISKMSMERGEMPLQLHLQFGFLCPRWVTGSNCPKSCFRRARNISTRPCCRTGQWLVWYPSWGYQPRKFAGYFDWADCSSPDPGCAWGKASKTEFRLAGEKIK